MLGSTALLLNQSAQAQTDAKPDFVKQVWASFYGGTRVWGYANKHSVDVGQTFHLMLSTGPGVERVTGIIEIFRIGYYENSDRQLVFRSEPQGVDHQEVQMTACSVGASWPTANENVETKDWRPGFYTIDFVDNSDGQRDLNVAYIVVTDPDLTGDILVWLCTNTYQAYNEWGGGSLYASAFTGNRAQVVSFDRPTPPDFFEYDYFLVRWIEQSAAERNWRVGYTTNFDMYREPRFADKYRLLISGCHNEDWSKEEYEQVHRRIFLQGKNTIFMGANSAYWQVRYVDNDRPPDGLCFGRQMVCYKSIDDPIGSRVSNRDRLLLTTMMFREKSRLPETMLAGVAYQSYFQSFSPKQYPYIVADIGLPLFADTGYKIGDTTPNVVGYEWDNTDPNGDGKRLWDAYQSLIPELDRKLIRVVFTGNPIDLDGKPGKAEAVYFESPAGGKVFSTGSIRWAWGLGRSGFEQNAFKTFNRNLLLHMLSA